MKQLRIFLFLAVVCMTAFSFNLKAQQYDWVSPIGGLASDMCLALATDSLDNVYTAGFFSGTADFGLGPVAAHGGTDAFIMKRNSSGAILWVRTLGGASDEEIQGLSFSSHGFLYAAGWFRSASIVIDSTTSLVNADSLSQNAFVLKLDLQGNVEWARQSEGGASEQAHAIACVPSGGVVVAGAYMDTALFDSVSLVSYGNRDIFIVQYDESGSIVFADHAGGQYDDACFGIACDGSSFSITGYFNCGIVEHGTAHFGNAVLTSSGYTDVFIAKYTPSGGCLWARDAGGPLMDEGRSIAVSSSGNIGVTGMCAGTSVFGADTLFVPATADAFVVLYDQYGGELWASQFGSTAIGSSVAYAIVFDESDNPIIAGGFENIAQSGQGTVASEGDYDLFVASYDHADGSPLWVSVAGGLEADWCTALAAGSSGVCYTAGCFSSPSVSFGILSLQQIGCMDGFVGKIHTDAVHVEHGNHQRTFSVYPNPARDQITIVVPAEKQSLVAVLYDALGNEVMRTNLAPDEETILNRGTIACGIYILILFDDDGFCASVKIVFE